MPEPNENVKIDKIVGHQQAASKHLTANAEVHVPFELPDESSVSDV